ncbi:MAG: hypothetical protein RLZZ378_936, partial [Actinomycetota bacterium]
TLNKIVDAHDSAQIAFDGDDLVSTGQRVRRWTVRDRYTLKVIKVNSKFA